MAGSIRGWKMIFLVCVASSVMTPARPTSEPVPAVVGTAMIGAMPLGIGARPPVADILEIPHRPRLPGHEGDDLADVERRAAAEGDDAVMAAGAKTAMPSSTFLRPGLRLAHRRRAPSARLPSVGSDQRRAIIGGRARPGSVTSSGRSMPSALQASASSAIRPAPKRTLVG